MKFEIVTEVMIPGVGKSTYHHEQEFEDDSNVFGRVYDYRQHIYKTFPGCNYRLVKAKQVYTTGKDRQRNSPVLVGEKGIRRKQG